jgi:hypothetical protein
LIGYQVPAIDAFRAGTASSLIWAIAIDPNILVAFRTAAGTLTITLGFDSH